MCSPYVAFAFVSSVECRVSSVECRGSSVECRVSSVERRASSVERRVSSVECLCLYQVCCIIWSYISSHADCDLNSLTHSLCCAVLCCAVLRCAALCCAVLCCAVLCCAVLCCALPIMLQQAASGQHRPQPHRTGRSFRALVPHHRCVRQPRVLLLLSCVR
eukprot:COSAG06_NODE_2888_length_6131_cov_117.688660_9_plen_161_part_00